MILINGGNFAILILIFITLFSIFSPTIFYVALEKYICLFAINLLSNCFFKPSKILIFIFFKKWKVQKNRCPIIFGQDILRYDCKCTFTTGFELLFCLQYVIQTRNCLHHVFIAIFFFFEFRNETTPTHILMRSNIY